MTMTCPSQRILHVFGTYWFKLEVNSRRDQEDENGQLSVFDEKRFKLLGPSGCSIECEFEFYVQGSDLCFLLLALQ